MEIKKKKCDICQDNIFNVDDEEWHKRTHAKIEYQRLWEEYIT